MYTQELILVGLFSVNDEIRNKCSEAIKFLHLYSIDVRMMTGDVAKPSFIVSKAVGNPHLIFIRHFTVNQPL